MRRRSRKWTSQAARATPKSTTIRLNVVWGRSRPPWVALGSAGNAPGRARNGRWTPSWAVLGAMLAVLGAMLAVWDAKLTARGAPRTLRSARGARLCRHSAAETRSQRIHTRLVLRKPQFLQCLPPVWAILPRAAVMRENLENPGVSASKIESEGPSNEQVARKSGQCERKSSLEVPAGPPKI